jgi:indole-3-glycerol phosphate synthase
MNANFLTMITGKARAKTARKRLETDVAAVRKAAEAIRADREPFQFANAITGGGTNIIAEIKLASPSHGVLASRIDIPALARAYQAGGAAAISVLTEEEYFKGSLENLALVRAAVNLPVLRKDFIVDELQILEAAAAGADAVLLIVAALTAGELTWLTAVAADLGMNALVEVHSAEEISVAADAGANVIGINNRDLNTLDVSRDVSRELIGLRPPGALMVAESGISSAEEIHELKDLGFDAFLVGETLIRSGDPAAVLRSWG